MDVYDEIKAERFNQDEQHGGQPHDDAHVQEDWCEFILDHAERAQCKIELAPGFRKEMVKVAALAVAAIESFDRKKARQP